MSKLATEVDKGSVSLPGLDCGVCGFRLCSDLAMKAVSQPDIIKRCIHLSDASYQTDHVQDTGGRDAPLTCGTHAACASPAAGIRHEWQDTLGRDFDFYLEHFPEDPGPREIILPHNPSITREMDVKEGDTLIGRPLGMSCGCPITHCGVAMNVDRRTGVIVWCVTGPLSPRLNGFKDLGYYIAEGYEGLIRRARVDVRIGMRYYFQPHMCMLQWRHSGLVNYVNRTGDALQVRLEGLWIG